MRSDYLPAGLAASSFRSSDFGDCTNCNSSLLSEPVTDERVSFAKFCTPGCASDFVHIRMGVPRD